MRMCLFTLTLLSLSFSYAGELSDSSQIAIFAKYKTQEKQQCLNDKAMLSDFKDKELRTLVCEKLANKAASLRLKELIKSKCDQSSDNDKLITCANGKTYKLVDDRDDSAVASLSEHINDIAVRTLGYNAKDKQDNSFSETQGMQER